jgi:hypothetical protein
MDLPICSSTRASTARRSTASAPSCQEISRADTPDDYIHDPFNEHYWPGIARPSECGTSATVQSFAGTLSSIFSARLSAGSADHLRRRQLTHETVEPGRRATSPISPAPRR